MTELEFVTNAADAARENGYHLVLWTSEKNEPNELLNLTRQGLVDGLIIMEVRERDERIELLRETGIPFSVIGRCTGTTGLAYADIDFDQTTRDAIGYLAGEGHRHIAFLNQSQEVFDSGYGPVYPLYYMAKLAGLYNSQVSVILIFTVIQGAFGTYLLTSVFSAFPMELVEAAVVDGCGKLRLLVSVVVPMCMPTLLVLLTFFFIWTWNEFFLPLILLISNARQTVPIAISVTQSQHNMDATTASASALLGVLPCVVFFALFQRTLTRGIAVGSIK